MLKHLFRKRYNEKPQVPRTPSSDDAITVQSAETLLAEPHRQSLLQRIWQLTAMSGPQFEQLYLQPIHRYAHWVQRLPASENHHHAYLGGLLDHGLELVAYSLKLRQSHILPIGSAPEDQSGQAEAWTAGIAYGALLHDIGKIAVDMYIETADGLQWHPWHGPLQHSYRLHYIKGRDYHLHDAASGLLHQQILTPQIQDWLSTYPELWHALLYMLAGQHAHSGVLGELILQADRLSAANNLGGNPERLLDAPKASLQQHLLAGLRYLLDHTLKLNEPGAAGWLTEDSLWLVSKAVTDKLRAYLLSLGIEGIPTSNSRLFDELQAHRIIQPTADDKAIWTATVTDNDWQQRFTFLRIQPSLIWNNDKRPSVFSGSVEPEHAHTGEQHDAEETDTPPVNRDKPHGVVDSVPEKQSEDMKGGSGDLPMAEHFISWLKAGLSTHKLLINDTQAKVHLVEGKVLLVTPGIFQAYAKEHPERFRSLPHDEHWKPLQRQFEKLKLHLKRNDGFNIWTCSIEGPRRKSNIKGYLLKDAGLLFTAIPADNCFLALPAF